MTAEEPGASARWGAPTPAAAPGEPGPQPPSLPAQEPTDPRAHRQEPGPTTLHTRLQELAGENVLDRDGETVGVVRDIYQHDATGELAAITVVRRQLSSRSVLLPASAIAPLQRREDDDGAPPHALRLLVDAETARAGMRPPVTGHATPQDLREAAAALGLATEEPATERPPRP